MFEFSFLSSEAETNTWLSIKFHIPVLVVMLKDFQIENIFNSNLGQFMIANISEHLCCDL